ncbi:SDR family NAD(P)-dependent oxidoreductase [Humitalea sp. 24SJ18S-53]|uniref:SDR family NAD(P)-dependent oxidoreductase n=1 Tax=Humitalea sp. 24SJ18S-53 TaxID=3422307 RepID=UPI003D66C823
MTEHHDEPVGDAGAHPLLVDLQVAGAGARMVDEAMARCGRIDVLVNNAGIRCRADFGTFTQAEFDQLIAINLAAPFFASQAVIPAMTAQGGGRIIHVASQMGSVAAQGNALYGLSKAALIQLTRAMALELAPRGIMVNAVSPGPIATRFNLDRFADEPGRQQRIEAKVPAGRLGEPEEVAEAIVFLATCRGAFIHGHDLVVDGGYVIQ